jgi:hypothetical protein
MSGRWICRAAGAAEFAPPKSGYCALSSSLRVSRVWSTFHSPHAFARAKPAPRPGKRFYLALFETISAAAMIA